VSFLIATSSDWLGLAAAATTAPASAASTAFARVFFDRLVCIYFDKKTRQFHQF
jgi:hypothetical protein